MNTLIINKSQITHRTSKAICVAVTVEDQIREIWLPKSQITMKNTSPETIAISIPSWLVVEKNMWELVHREPKAPITVEFPEEKEEEKNTTTTDIESLIKAIGNHQKKVGLNVMGDKILSSMYSITSNDDPEVIASKLMDIINGNIF